MRKNTLLIAAAVAALAAGSGTVLAQAPKSDSPAVKSDSPAVTSNPASRNAPAEKIAPSPSAKTGGVNRIQGAEQKAPAADRSRMGEANERNKTKSEKTGQAQNERNKMNKSETTGQAPNQMQGQPAQRTAPKADKLNENNNAAGANQPNRPTSAQGATENRAGGSASVSLTTEQKTKIHSIIVADRSAPRVEHVDFQINVGTVVPRGKVKFARLPSTIVEIEPTWRGYEYFLVGDQIVVVDPATLRIVAVLET